ncbi:DUF2510 domain-containing protein [Agrococcus beijingensis]|uniref:DUF2510 domain-containing protein n=1 Tax=Agrococcus beijingensis TaxID=3068634 RepID=UPI003BEEE8B6
MDHTAPPNPPPGWYPYPDEAASVRWWDGAAWSNSWRPAPIAHHLSEPVQPPTPGILYTPGSREGGLRPRDRSSSDRIAGALAAAGPQWYWTNLVRIRFWWFLATGPLFLAIVAGFISPVLIYVVWPIAALLMAFVFLRTQMSCRQCGSLLAANKLGGNPNACPKCQTPTDAALAGALRSP